MQITRTKALGVCLTTLTLLGVSGCAAPAYNPDTDKLLSAAETDVDAGIVNLISDYRITHDFAADQDATARSLIEKAQVDGQYAANIPFYNRIDVELTGIALHMDAEAAADVRPHIDVALQDLRNDLVGAAGSLQATHRAEKQVSEIYLVTLRQQVDAQFLALLSYEQTLRNGASSTASTGTDVQAMPVAASKTGNATGQKD